MHFCQQLSQEVLEMWRWVNWTLLWLFCQTWHKEQWLYTRFSLNVLKYLDKLCHEVFPIHLSYINVVKGNQHIFYPVWPRPLSQKEIVKGNFYKRSSYAFQYTNCKRAPNYNVGQTFQFHEMELLVLLHEIDMHISRFRLPATLLKKAKNSSHSGGGNIRRNKMITGRRTVLSGWTTISTKTSFMKTSGELCKNLCKVSKVFRGVLDSDPGCPNEPEDLCYMDDFFFDPSLAERIFFQTFSEILTLKKTKKSFPFCWDY